MKFIAHRGNINGKEPERENSPDFIDEAIKLGFDVEIDVWRIDVKWFLGHDSPEYEIDLNWLFDRSDNLWCHAKNLNALHDMIHYPKLNCFWHEEDRYTLTSHGFIWTYPDQPIKEFSYKQIILLFDWKKDDVKIPHGGICSDEIMLYRDKYKS
jgi:hypothetical protein